MKKNEMFNIFILVVVYLSTMKTSKCAKSGKSRPNIIFIFADDMGWNEVGYHGSNQVPTPNIDALAYSGTILHNYYSQSICTPSRSALMTGRYPIRNGMQSDVIYAAEPWGLPLTEKLLPEYLKELGYINRAIGKWHLGFFKKTYTPIHRGFHSHMGYWLGHKDHFTHLSGEGGYRGYDFKRDLEHSWSDFGQYSTDIFTEEAEEIIKSHNPQFPLFLYIAHLAVHAPLQAPEELIHKFKHIKQNKRRIFAAMLTKLDESVGRVVRALKTKGILDNTIIVFTSDNGGATHGYDGSVGSNWPLRGSKDTLWEGGVRVPAIVWSPLLTTAPPIHRGLMSVSDWLPTLVSVANGTFRPEAKRRTDGRNQWPTLLGDCPEPSDILLHNIDRKRKLSALRKGNWKVISGKTHGGGFDKWYGKLYTNKTYDVYGIQNSMVAQALKGTSKPLPSKTVILKRRNATTVHCFPAGKRINRCLPGNSPCLFNIAIDPCEKNNLAKKYPHILHKLLRLIAGYKPVREGNTWGDPTCRPVYWNYTWTHWQDFPLPRLLNSDYQYIDEEEK